MKVYKENDNEILNMLHSDKAAGFRMLFDTYYTPLCLFSLQLTDDFNASEDIVQSFFTTFWEKTLHSRIEDNLKSYLFTSVRNNTLQYLKKQGKANHINLDNTILGEDTYKNLIVDDDHCNEWEEREKQLYHELHTLSEKERDALQRVVLDEKSYKEASLEMGVTINTLKTHLKRAMKKLRKTSFVFSFIF